MKRTELIAKRAALKAEFKGWLAGVLAAANTDHRGLTPGEGAKQAEYEAQLAELDAEFEKTDAVIDAGPIGPAFGALPSGLSSTVVPADEIAPAALMLPPLPSRSLSAIAGMFRDVPAAASEETSQNFRNTVVAVLGGLPLHPAVLAATQTEGVPADGGFAVMPDTARGLFSRAAEASVFLRIGVRLEPMRSEERTIVALDDDDETEDAEANVKAKWKKEAGTATAQIVKLRQVVLHAHKLMVLATTSSELSDDAGPGFLLELEAALSRAIAKKLDRSILTGTGAGAPLGLLNAPATITIAKEGSQPAATFLWENAVKMWARLAPGSHENSWWLMHPSVLPQALTMTLKIKNVAGTENVGGSQPRGAFEPGGPTGYMLLGRPVVITSRCKALGTAGDVMLVDPSQIVVGIRRAISIERSTHIYFDSDTIAVRGKFRGDARPVWDKARTLVEGPDTVSPYLILATRA